IQLSRIMGISRIDVRLDGENYCLPSIRVGDRIVVVSGGFIRTAMIYEDLWLEETSVKNPETFLAQIKQEKLDADVFTFSQRLPEVTPKYDFHLDWDNVAAIPLKTFEDWWQNRLPQESRKNVRRAAKRGVNVRSVQLDEQL